MHSNVATISAVSLLTMFMAGTVLAGTGLEIFADSGDNITYSGLVKDTVVPLAGLVIAIIALVWTIINYFIQRSGYFKLQLKCRYECNRDRRYIVCRTSLDNTSIKPIYYVHAFLIIVEQDISEDRTQELINDAVSEMKVLLSEYNSKGRNIVDNGKSEGLLKMIFKHIARNKSNMERSNIGVLEDTSTIKFLPYFTMHTRLGSLAHMSVAHVHETSNTRIYSVYFVVIGEEWYRKKGPSQARYSRAVHDEASLYVIYPRILN